VVAWRLRFKPSGFSTELRSVAEWFVELQQERHRADYDPSGRSIESELYGLFGGAQEAFAECFANRWAK